MGESIVKHSADITVNSDILVIDDSVVVLAVVRNILDGLYNVRVASSAKEAYDLMQEKIPDLILLDVEMPEINGFAFFETIKSTPEWSDIPVIFLTGVDDRKKEEQALELGAVEYILKPIAENILRKRVQFHLELRIYRKNLENAVTARTEELLRVQKEIQSAADTAKSALKDKSKFLANMSHEIKTPMNVIMGTAEAALEGDISAEHREYFNKIKSNTRILLRVINDILDISKIDAGKMEIERISFNPGTLFKNCQTMIAQQINDKGLEFNYHVDKTLLDIQLLGDPVRLYQTMQNLLSNAMKFTDKGSVSLTATAVSTNDEFSLVRLEVSDTGRGMTEEQLASVFEPFVQVGNEVTRVDLGTGLGLPIIKSLVELMGGTLTAESKLGAGSKFTVELKLPITESVSLFNEAFGNSETDTESKPSFNGEILVCEDDRVNQDVIREHLKRVGLTSVIVDNGLEGLRIVIDRMKKGAKPFDLILMDTQMPVMDGFEATARINALGTGTPVVALAANVMTKDLEDYKRYGLMDCISKPFQTWDLWRCLLIFMMPVQGDFERAGSDEKERILIIDDEKSNIIALTHFLRDEYSIYVTRDSRDSVEMIVEHKPAVILLDIIMPEMDGYEVITEIKKNEEIKNIPIIFISGLTSPEAMVRGLSLGAADYIPKPFEASVVKEKIKRLLNR